ncbi:MAG: TrkH family potassium uptake protein, partial [Clostridia bacterium]|nr:TrkH family potassium uptake protein [Clostridia bacterium]
MVFNTLGRMSLVCAACLMLPAIVSLIYGEHKSMQAFVVVSAGAAVLGFLLLLIFRSKNQVIYAKEGFAIAALSWIGISAIGAVPFVISGAIPNYVNAFFETVSGFTTTGASILTDVESLSHGMLFWRSFTHWLGGMGVIVLVMAIVRNVSDRSIHLMRAEMPGPVIGKLLPKARDTAKILYYIYIALTLTEVAFLWAGDMNLFEAFVHTFGTAGTGGFSVKNASIGAYGTYSQVVITVFMLMFGLNFNLYYLLLMRKFKTVLKSSEMRLYLSLFFVSACIITWNISSMYESIGGAVKDSAFAVSSIITTTGYTTTDMNSWPVLSKSILLVLMCIGSCAGSTAGGLKVSRVILIFKQILREIKHMLHPRS